MKMQVAPLASIRPRPFSRGNVVLEIVVVVPLTVLQFGHDLSAVETEGERMVLRDALVLQFGHDLSAVETWSLDYKCDPIETTLQFGHDLSAVETIWYGSTYCWSLVASIRPRPFSRGNFRNSYQLCCFCDASIRPRPFSRGNMPQVPPL